ncbi:MAG: hypothetical protein ACKOB0_01015, partial [Chthoniobacterales bacterium]
MKKTAFLLLLALAGCSGGTLDSSREYRAAMAERPGVTFSTADDGRRASGRFSALYGDLSEQNVKDRVRETYAPEAWFNDTIATEVGI